MCGMIEPCEGATQPQRFKIVVMYRGAWLDDVENEALEREGCQVIPGVTSDLFLSLRMVWRK